MVETVAHWLECISAAFHSAQGGDPRGFIALVFAAVGVACLGSLVFQFRIDRWPTVRGRIRQAGVQEAGGASARVSQMYVEALEYEYRVDGTDYVGRRLSPWVVSASHNAKGLLAWRMRGLEPGAEVAVIHNPRRPEKSFLRRSGPLGKAVTVAMAIPMLAMPAILF
jgi:hypothetical protein